MPGNQPPPALLELDKCVHCGFCLHDCPTYDVLREEPDSPRGRIALIDAVESGRLEPGERFAQHISLCVGCLACQSACPAGVEYGALLEHARAKLGPQGTPGQRRALKLAFRHVLPYPGRVRLVAGLTRLYQRSGLQALLRKSGLLKRLGPIQRLDAMMPTMPAANFNPPEVLPAIGERKFRVGFLSGCVMGTAFAPSNENSIKLLRRAGCEVVIPKGQTCCGALNLHYGDAAGARAMAWTNIQAFGDQDLDAIIVNAAGCGASMKKYDSLFWDDPAAAPAAKRFAGLVRDITEFLDDILPDTTTGSLPRQRVTYQDPCHLAHGQGIRQAPRRLLARIDGLELVEMKQPDRCCGSAGIYNVLQEEMSETLLAAKMDDIAATGAQTVVAPNPGCILQLQHGARQRGLQIRVEHIVDLLAAAQDDAR